MDLPFLYGFFLNLLVEVWTQICKQPFYPTLPTLSPSLLGYVHTVPDRFLLHFKRCSGTVWTRINVLLWCRNCSEAFPVWTQALSVIQFTTLPFDLKRSFTNMRFHCNFCSDRSVQTWLRPFQKPIQYGTFHFQQRSRAVLFQSRKCFESSIPGVNRSLIWYTFCDVPFHCLKHCEHSFNQAFSIAALLYSAWLSSCLSQMIYFSSLCCNISAICLYGSFLNKPLQISAHTLSYL